METKSSTVIAKCPGWQVIPNLSLFCVFRGNTESYYSGTFIVPNTLVDRHLQILGYNNDVIHVVPKAIM